MLCVTSDGFTSVDAEYEVLEKSFPFYEVEKVTETSFKTVVDSIDWVQAIARAYAFVETDAQGNVTRSSPGVHRGATLYVGKEKVLLAYEPQEKLRVVVEKGARLNFPFWKLTPIAYHASEFSFLVDTLPESYLCMGDMLVENYHQGTWVPLDAKFLCMAGPSVVAAFDMTVGSLLPYFTPIGKKGCLALMKRWRFMSKNGAVPHRGVVFSDRVRGLAKDFVRSVKMGQKPNAATWCLHFDTPTSGAWSTAATPVFMIRADGAGGARGSSEDYNFRPDIRSLIFGGDSLPGVGIEDLVNAASLDEELRSCRYYGVASDDLDKISTDFAVKYAELKALEAGRVSDQLENLGDAIQEFLKLNKELVHWNDCAFSFESGRSSGVYFGERLVEERTLPSRSFLAVTEQQELVEKFFSSGFPITFNYDPSKLLPVGYVAGPEARAEPAKAWEEGAAFYRTWLEQDGENQVMTSGLSEDWVSARMEEFKKNVFLKVCDHLNGVFNKLANLQGQAAGGRGYVPNDVAFIDASGWLVERIEIKNGFNARGGDPVWDVTATAPCKLLGRDSVIGKRWHPLEVRVSFLNGEWHFSLRLESWMVESKHMLTDMDNVNAFYRNYFRSLVNICKQETTESGSEGPIEDLGSSLAVTVEGLGRMCLADAGSSDWHYFMYNPAHKNPDKCAGYDWYFHSVRSRIIRLDWVVSEEHISLKEAQFQKKVGTGFVGIPVYTSKATAASLKAVNVEAIKWLALRLAEYGDLSELVALGRVDGCLLLAKAVAEFTQFSLDSAAFEEVASSLASFKTLELDTGTESVPLDNLELAADLRDRINMALKLLSEFTFDGPRKPWFIRREQLPVKGVRDNSLIGVYTCL